jgi:hypothetical protein
MTRKIVDLALIVVGITFVGMAMHSWISAKRDERQLQAALADQQKAISGAAARESKRDEALRTVVNDISNLKKKIHTPAQVIQQMPKYLQLPQPIGMITPAPATPEVKSIVSSSRDQQGGNATGKSSASARSSATIPTVDLKPLFDFVQDCRTCQAQLTAAHQDALDEGTKLTAVTNQRDLAVKEARGGSFWHRLRRNIGWFAAGIAGGYAASRL